MYRLRKICIFIANDAGRYAFEKLVGKKIIDCAVIITQQKAEKLGVSNYYDISEVFNGYIHYAKKYSLKTKQDLEWFKENRFDLGFVLGWNRLIPDEVIKTFKIGIFGFHGTPFDLPIGRGRSPSIWSMVLGYKEFNLHMFKVDEGVDSGDIIDVDKLEINETDDIKIFHYKTSVAVYEMIVRNLDRLIDGYIGKPQKGIPVYFRKRTEKDGRINWKLPTRMIYNLIRAITKPYPGAWTVYKGEKIRIWKAYPFSKKLFKNRKVGEVCAVFEDSFVVKTGDGTLIVREWEPKVDFKEYEWFH